MPNTHLLPHPAEPSRIQGRDYLMDGRVKKATEEATIGGGTGKRRRQRQRWQPTARFGGGEGREEGGSGAGGKKTERTEKPTERREKLDRSAPKLGEDRAEHGLMVKRKREREGREAASSSEGGSGMLAGEGGWNRDDGKQREGRRGWNRDDGKQREGRSGVDIGGWRPWREERWEVVGFKSQPRQLREMGVKVVTKSLEFARFIEKQEQSEDYTIKRTGELNLGTLGSLRLMENKDQLDSLNKRWINLIIEYEP